MNTSTAPLTITRTTTFRGPIAGTIVRVIASPLPEGLIELHYQGSVISPTGTLVECVSAIALQREGICTYLRRRVEELYLGFQIAVHRKAGTFRRTVEAWVSQFGSISAQVAVLREIECRSALGDEYLQNLLRYLPEDAQNDFCLQAIFECCIRIRQVVVRSAFRVIRTSDVVVPGQLPIDLSDAW